VDLQEIRLEKNESMRAKLMANIIKTLRPKEQPYEVRDTILPGFLLRVQPSGAMTYYLAYRTTDGRKTRYRIGAVGAVTPAQARDMAEQLSARAVQGEDVQATKQQRRDAAEMAKVCTLGGFLEHQYSPWLLAERPEKRRGAEMIQRLRANFTEWLERPLSEINPWLVEKWRAEQVKRGKAKSTINRDLTTLRSVMSKAVAWQVIDQHPLKSVKPLKVDTHAVIRFLSEDEEDRLRQALVQRDAQIKAARGRGNAWRRARGYDELPTLDQQTYGDQLTPMVLLSLNTGVRRGELFALHWGDVNLQRKLLTIRGTTTKSGQTRHIPLNRIALEVLQAWHQQGLKAEVVFPGKNGGQRDNTRKSWSGVLRVAGICNFRWHDLRHTFASRLVMAGVPLNTVRELLGHTTPSMTLRYAHLAPDHKAHAVEQLCAPGAISQQRVAHA
jgi:integrase